MSNLYPCEMMSTKLTLKKHTLKLQKQNKQKNPTKQTHKNILMF